MSRLCRQIRKDRLPATCLAPSPRIEHRGRGVVLVLVLLAMVLLAALVMYVFNLAHHVNQRRRLQDVADASAQAGASWMARGLNTVAMNNVAITRLIAAANVIDAMPLAVRFTLTDQVTLSESLRRQMRCGVNGFWVRESLQEMRDEVDHEISVLDPVDALFATQDIAALTMHESPAGRGAFWKAMGAADTISTMVMETLDVLAQRSARGGVESNTEVQTRSVMLPLLPEVMWRRGQFDDFRRPVTMGLLPSTSDDKVVRRGPWDTVFGWRDLIGGTRDDYFMPGSIQNANQGTPNVPIGRDAGKGNGHMVMTSYQPAAYRVFGPFNWMLRRMRGFRHAYLWHSRFDHWVGRIATRKLHYLWPADTDEGLGARIVEPTYVTDFEAALEIAAAEPHRIVETLFVAVEVKSLSPLISAARRDAWTYVTADKNRPSPRVVRVRGWENPLAWNVTKMTGNVWRDTWSYQAYVDPEIGILPRTKTDGTTLMPQDVYRTDDFVFVAINVGTPVNIRNPNNFANQSELAAPIELQAASASPTTARQDGFRTLGIVQQADNAPMWGRRFSGRKPYPHVVATAQCAVFNNHSWDTWTQMWHVRVEPVTNYDTWLLRIDEAEAQSSTGHAAASPQTMPQIDDLATYLRSTTDLAKAMLSH